MKRLVNFFKNDRLWQILVALFFAVVLFFTAWSGNSQNKSNSSSASNTFTQTIESVPVDIKYDSDIIVLDEATAFADPENEQLIRRALAELTRGKTVLLIAHRLTNVVDADAILVIDQGLLVQQGTHQALVEQEGLYRSMWEEYNRSINWTI